MKQWALITLICGLFFLAFLFNKSWFLIRLLFENFELERISQGTILYSDSHYIDPKKQVIPRIIHQTWKNETIPEKWEQAYSSCKKNHPNYEYIFWTDEKARNFIAQEYSWFLDQYDKYPYNIQRVDSFRYFALVHYGGIYIDLDVVGFMFILIQLINTWNRNVLNPLIHFFHMVLGFV